MAGKGQQMEQKHLCEACRERKARFQYRGVVKADRAHTLCFACFRSERDRLRARALVTEPSRASSTDSEAGRAARTFPTAPVQMTPAQRAHRLRMLANLTRAEANR